MLRNRISYIVKRKTRLVWFLIIKTKITSTNLLQNEAKMMHGEKHTSTRFE